MTYQTNLDVLDETEALGDGLPPGTTLCDGQYTIDKYLNSGGFGITYLARDSLDRRVVIKECFPNAICCRAGDDVRLRSQSFDMDFGRAVELFQKEARALAQLQHPNIVGVHQIFLSNGTAYMALDFVEGTDLFELLIHKPEVLRPAAVQELSVLLLRALSYVHKNGILHRDISPDNILLDMTGAPVLIDFGAARQSATQASRILSRVHTVKDGYSPHEFYIAGSAQSPSSDLYALAATFVHLIEGHPPPNSSLRLAAVAEQKPDPYVPIRGRFPDYDDTFLASVDTCMSLFAKDRLQNADAWLAVITGDAQTGIDSDAQGDIERIVAELVETTQDIVQASAGSKEPVEEDQEDPAEVARREAEREYWAILSEDPSDWYDDTRGTRSAAQQEAGKQTRKFSLSNLLPKFGRGSQAAL